jgi:hypothetical protein
MAVAVDANATADATANGVTSINTSNLTIGAGSNRALVVGINWSDATSAIALTWDNGASNQAMAAIPSATITSGIPVVKAELWGLVNPISGAKQLRAAWTTACDVVINGTSWTGVDQTGGATSFPNGTGATSTSTTASVTVTSATNDAVQATHTAMNTIASVNNTQLYRDNTPANISGAGNRAAGAASVAMTATLTSAKWGTAGASIKAAGAVTFIAPPSHSILQAVKRAAHW